MSFSGAIAKARSVAETENLKKGDAPRAQTSPTAFEQRKTVEDDDEEEDEEGELRMPGSLDAIGMLGNVRRRMQLR
jgi:hypothetical protein